MIQAQGTPRSDAWYARHGNKKAKMTNDNAPCKPLPLGMGIRATTALNTRGSIQYSIGRDTPESKPAEIPPLQSVSNGTQAESLNQEPEAPDFNHGEDVTTDDLLEWLKATYGYERTFKVKAVARRLGHANTAAVRGGVRALVNRHEVAVAFEKNFYNIYQVVRP